MEKQLIAIIRIHGKSGLKKGIRDTLDMLKLYKKHNCVIVKNTHSNVGMIKKVKEYVTWGEINEETFVELLTKRGKLARKKSLTDEYLKEKLNLDIKSFAKEVFTFKKSLKDLPGLKLFFKLSPPRGGYESGGIKKQFALGGVLGYRKDKINDFLKNMV